MAQSYFQFKEFLIRQSRSAMKVTTEGCLFGALVTASTPTNILDIGTGTGLLGLMLAQRYKKAQITGIEIHSPAAEEAELNRAASPWSDRIKIIGEDARVFRFEDPFDMIVSNPPFFQESLRSSLTARNQAKHETSLTMDNLLNIVNQNMAGTGVFWVIYPRFEALDFHRRAVQSGLHLQDEIMVFDRVERSELRRVQSFGFKPKEVRRKQLIIKKNDGKYTLDFVQLLKPFYLHL